MGCSERIRVRGPRHSRLAILTVVAVAAAALSGAATARVGAAPSAPVTELRTLESDRTGVTDPVGIAFSAKSKTFHVLQKAARGGASGAETEVVDVDATGSLSGRKGTDRIAALVADPINVAYDAGGNRLLLASQRELVTVGVATDGRLVPGSGTRHSISRLGLVAPRGVAVDPASGAVFVLDAATSRIVRVAGGSPDQSLATIDLKPMGIGEARGLALDPVSRHLFVRGGSTLYELTQAGDVVSTHDLSQLGLTDPEGMVFAPSGDETDDPATESLYVADAGAASGGLGQIAELSLQPQVAAAASNFTSTVAKVTDASLWSPPSPDPDGITYVPATQRLVISDSEVEETVQGITHFQGANVWETNLGGSVLRSANISTISNPNPNVRMSNEPTGVAWDPVSGHYFFSSDAPAKVYDLNPGADNLIGTGDDTWTSFSTVVSPNNDKDCEGITYDTANGHLFTSDGVNQEIYEYTKTGTLVNHFDVAQYGVGDPETVEYNAASDTLFTLSNRQSGPIIVETTTSGALIQTIDVSAMTGSGGRKPAGLAYAPASDGSGQMRFYVVDRGIDNNSNPNIIDGKLFELTAPQSGGTNQAPTVDAGPPQTITLPAQASLNGTVNDDGLPNGQLTTTWSMTSGPTGGTVTFGDPSAVDTTATFSAEGTYVLRLTADDGALQSFDEVTITVNPSTGGDVIFSDGFESGSFSAWSSSTTGGGDLSVTAAAKNSGTFGMQAVINDNTALYVTDDTPAAEPRYRARFYYNPNGIAMAAGDLFYVFQGLNSGGTVVVRLPVRLNGTQYQVRGAVRTDGGTYTSTVWIPITGWSAIELDWQAASAPGANDGHLTMWVNGVQQATLTGIDNDTMRVDSGRLGANNVATGTRGTIFFDDFVSHRQTYIGP